jgi:2-keto-4-pentenoate hydratase
VVGDRVDVDPAELRDVEVVVRRDGVAEARGLGSIVLGDPANALVWLVNALAKRGEAIMDGDVVTTGACALVEEVKPGQVVSASFGDRAEVQLSFE